MDETTDAYTPSPNETLFTRIVRAIHNTGAEHGTSTTNGQLAIAVLEAIRDPTTAMLIAGRKRLMADMTGAHMGPDCEATWVAMAEVAIEQAREMHPWEPKDPLP
jgi:hypothetical protein